MLGGFARCLAASSHLSRVKVEQLSWLYWDPICFRGAGEGAGMHPHAGRAREKTLHWLDEVSFSFFGGDSSSIEARRMDRDARPKILRYDTIQS
jgi:hypothetical protein